LLLARVGGRIGSQQQDCAFGEGKKKPESRLPMLSICIPPFEEDDDPQHDDCPQQDEPLLQLLLLPPVAMIT
jgi:hypothetical protein